MQLWNLGSDCRERAGWQRFGRSKILASLCLGAALKGSCPSYIVDMSVPGHVPCWYWAWPTDLTFQLDLGPALSLWTCLVIWTLGCLWLPSPVLLCSSCSGTTGLPFLVRVWPCGPCCLRSQLPFPYAAVPSLLLFNSTLRQPNQIICLSYTPFFSCFPTNNLSCLLFFCSIAFADFPPLYGNFGLRHWPQ